MDCREGIFWLTLLAMELALFMILPTQLSAGIALLLIAPAGLVYSLFHGWSKKYPWGSAFIICLSLNAGVCALLVGYYPRYLAWRNQPVVYKDFEQVHGMYGQLGNPVGDAVPSGGAYQATHEHARVIWIAQALTFFVVPNDHHKEIVSQPDPDWGSESSGQFPECKKRNLLPPFAGVAANWTEEPSEWSWIGCVKWECIFSDKDKTIRYQAFEHGKVIGPFRLNPHVSAGKLFVLMDDRTWHLDVYYTG